MQIELSTDNHIQGTDELKTVVEELVRHPLARFQSRVTRLEVHLGDENGPRKTPDDKRCMLEARLEGRKPTSVVAHADTLEGAVRSAARKLQRALEHELGKLDARSG